MKLGLFSINILRSEDSHIVGFKFGIEEKWEVTILLNAEGDAELNGATR